MIRANIKDAKDVYIGLIEEDNNLFRIMWNKNMRDFDKLKQLSEDEVFQTFEEACQSVYKYSHDAKVCETIYFKPKINNT